MHAGITRIYGVVSVGKAIMKNKKLNAFATSKRQIIWRLDGQAGQQTLQVKLDEKQVQSNFNIRQR